MQQRNRARSIKSLQLPQLSESQHGTAVGVSRLHVRMGGETSGCIRREAAHAAGSADTGGEEVATGFLAGAPAPMTEYGGWLRFSWCHPPDFKKGKQRA